MRPILRRLFAGASALAMALSSSALQTVAADLPSPDAAEYPAAALNTQGTVSRNVANYPTNDLVPLKRAPSSPRGSVPAVTQRLENTLDEQSCGASADWNTSTDYFYNQLGDNQKAYLDYLNELCEEIYYSNENLTEFYGDKHYEEFGINEDELLELLNLFVDSNPKYFFIWGTGDYGIWITPEFCSGARRKYYRDAIEKITDEWMQEIEAQKTPLDKELLILKKIADTVEYHYDEYGEPVLDANSQTIGGALVDKTTVCAGYARTAQYFCNAAGLDCFEAISQSHAWNVVNLYGNWYEFDITWADPDRGSYDSYYLDYSLINKSKATFNDLEASSFNENHLFVGVDDGTDDPTYTRVALPDMLYDTVKNYSCTVSFDTGCSAEVPSQTDLEWGSKVNEPEEPTQPGKYFLGWYSDDKYIKRFDFDYDPAQDITLKAAWYDGSSEFLINSDGVITDFIYTEEDSVTIPAYVTGMTDYAVESLHTFPEIANIEVEEGNTAFKSVDGALYTADGKTLVAYPTARTGSYTVLPGTRRIGKCAFDHCQITEIVVPKSVKSIGLFCFASDTLETLTLPSGMTKVDFQSLDYMTGLKTVNFEGTEEEWQRVAASGYYRSDATINYNYQYPDMPLSADEIMDNIDVTYSVLLDGSIGVNLYIDTRNIPEEKADFSKLYVDFTVRDNTTRVYTPSAAGEGYYVFTYFMDILEVAHDINFDIYYEDAKKSDYCTIDYYIDYFREHGDEVTKNMVNALSDYAFHTQKLIEQTRPGSVELYNLPENENFSQEDMESAHEALKAFSFDVTNSNSGISKIRCSLDILSKTSMYIYLTPEQGYNGEITVTVDGVEAGYERDNNGVIRIKIENISALELAKEHTIKINAKNTIEIKGSALAYANESFDRDSYQSNAMTALYRYYEAAVAYNNQPG